MDAPFLTEDRIRINAPLRGVPELVSPLLLPQSLQF